MTKPFLILQARPDEIADHEYNAFLKYGELNEGEVRRIRMEEAGIPKLNLDDYSAVIVGGGPYNVSDDENSKSDEQIRLEKDLRELLEEIVDKDFPYMGACYGFGALSQMYGGRMSKERYSETVGVVNIELNAEGETDKLLSGFPKKFDVFAGHKEACQKMPEGAVLLASSKDCPVHIYRMKKYVYAIQFHPELDIEGIIKRINVYKHHGYFKPRTLKT